MSRKVQCKVRFTGETLEEVRAITVDGLADAVSRMVCGPLPLPGVGALLLGDRGCGRSGGPQALDSG